MKKIKGILREKVFTNTIIYVYLAITMVPIIFIGLNSDALINKYMLYASILIFIIAIILLGIELIKNSEKKEKHLVRNILASIYLVVCILFLVVVYGPNHAFRDWFVTTALTTMTHKHYANWFYSDDVVAKVVASNYIISPDFDTNPDLIDQEIVYSNIYENEYEKQILSNVTGDYKIIEFKVNGQNAYLAAIYDPSMVKVGVSEYLFTRGEYVTAMAEKKNAMLAINGGGFSDPNHSGAGGTPEGLTVSAGQIVDTSKTYHSSFIGINEDNVLVLIKDATQEKIKSANIRDGVSRGPFLIVNGTAAITSGNGGWGYAARTAIGQRADGIILFLVVDSNEFRTGGADMSDLVEIMQNYGAINASNLDGGTSSVMVENFNLINTPIDSSLSAVTRPIATSFLVY